MLESSPAQPHAVCSLFKIKAPAGGVDQFVGCLDSKQEALGLIPSTAEQTQNQRLKQNKTNKAKTTAKQKPGKSGCLEKHCYSSSTGFWAER